MDLMNILYTPLDTKDVPNFNTEDLMYWINQNLHQPVIQRKDASLKTDPNLYPWNISYAKLWGHWQSDFKEKFPVLADYFSSVFDLPESAVNNIVLLPTKDEFEGVGFWHADPDEIGLRVYLENDDYEKDFLLIKPTIHSYNSREELGLVPNDGIDPKRFREEIHVANILKPKQAFFLNNIRAIHAAKISKVGKKRIAVLIILNMPFIDMPDPVKNLLERSYLKYKNLAILRQD